MYPENIAKESKPHAGMTLTVEAPARLHMGFLDIGGSLGRKFGSIGVGINEISTRVSFQSSGSLECVGPDSVRATIAAEKISTMTGRPLPALIRIEHIIPGHSGLGSGTQLALAIGLGLSRLHGLGLDPVAIAAAMGRGRRSGIGIATFERGGFIVDGGRGSITLVPPVLSRVELPANWRFIVVLDSRAEGLHGNAEINAFRELPVFPSHEAARLCHLLVMKGLPGLMEGDINAFGSVITEVQATVGDYFAPAQGGRFTSIDVGHAMAFLAARGAVGVGQSSWGPTGFCLVENPAMAERLLVEARANFEGNPFLRFLVCTARNQGALISTGMTAKTHGADRAAPTI